jgi:hypothetical protein
MEAKDERLLCFLWRLPSDAGITRPRVTRIETLRHETPEGFFSLRTDGSISSCVRRGESDTHVRTVTQFGLKGDLSPVRHNNLLRDGQTQPRAGNRARARV